jgi:hypothetical protein
VESFARRIGFVIMSVMFFVCVAYCMNCIVFDK